jgi:hypothetical protein
MDEKKMPSNTKNVLDNGHRLDCDHAILALLQKSTKEF